MPYKLQVKGLEQSAQRPPDHPHTNKPHRFAKDARSFESRSGMAYIRISTGALVAKTALTC